MNICLDALESQQVTFCSSYVTVIVHKVGFFTVSGGTLNNHRHSSAQRAIGSTAAKPTCDQDQAGAFSPRVQLSGVSGSTHPGWKEWKYFCPESWNILKHLQKNKEEFVTTWDVLKVPNHFESDETNHGNDECKLAEYKLQIKIDERLKLQARKLTILWCCLFKPLEISDTQTQIHFQRRVFLI